MIVYNNTKAGFCLDILTNRIETIISDKILKAIGRRTPISELRAFTNSLAKMYVILVDNGIPQDCGVSIEYNIPQTSKRVDFIITGRNEQNENVIIIELKQWESCALTDRDGIVKTYVGGSIKDTSHPSYQAYSYSALMQSFNQTVQDDNIKIYPCAYLHNYETDDNINNPFYSYYIEKAPLFLKDDAIKLIQFISGYIQQGDNNEIIYRIDEGKIRPSKTMADAINSLLQGNEEFIMIDDQKVVYENIKQIALRSSERNKNVIIVKGGAGTGKTVVAINLLVDLINSGDGLAQYVTKTSAPRDVYFSKLKGTKKLIELKQLFVSSGSFMKSPRNSIRTLLVDEAHRLTMQTGFLRRGENQIKEIINTALCSVFFIDEDQRVSVEDYGNIDRIERIAKVLNANIHYYQLSSQFRCNGSDGYIGWLDNTLQLRETANYYFDKDDYDFDFRIYDNPNDLRDIIFEKNKINNKARLVAGYCWDWKSKKDPEADDIIIPEYNFSMKWNFFNYASGWIIDPNSVNEVGCIHTCQGLEVDYIGVIVGKDLLYREEELITVPQNRSKTDRTLNGYKKRLRENPDYADDIRTIILNTYKTLMTRGMKGCYVYFEDKVTADYFKSRMISTY
ncbi:AAA family ATPase [bacterium BRH_c32]|nr:MAG: AAA family ATPase [bacterium BRH_c32]